MTATILSGTTGHPAEARGFRADIQGLRAICVLAIVLFHLDLEPLAGGFVGVDIFMVISGFLITGILMRSPRDRLFLPFWDRRIRRLFPALFATLAGTSLLALLALEPADLVDYAASALASAFYVANFYFTGELGYFDRGASFEFLLHTWSLAVEEQFYIVLPFCVFLLGARRSAVGWALAAWVASFALAMVPVVLGRGESYGFYLLPTRAWEFLTGGLVYLLAAHAPRRVDVAAGLALAGGVLIVLSILLIDESMVFPGYVALAPVLGTALVLFSGIKAQSFAHRALGVSPLRLIGDMSYSLYLVHWPVTVFARHFYGEERLAPERAPVLLLVILLLGYLSWRHVETPFRSSAIPARRFYGPLAGSAVALVAFAGIVQGSGGLPMRAPSAEAAVVETSDPAFAAYNLGCIRAWGVRPLPDEMCRFGDPQAEPRILLWGDSHADALGHALNEIGRERGFAGLLGVSGGCPPVDRLYRDDGGRCARKNARVRALLEGEPGVELVILHARWAMSFGLGPFGQAGNRVDLAKTRHHDARSAEAAVATKADALAALVADLQASGRRVILVGPVPELGRDPTRALRVQGRFGLDPEIAVTREAFETRQAMTHAMLERVVGRTGVQVLHPAGLLCDGGLCRARDGAALLYHDDDHLGLAGARRLVDAILAAVGGPP